MHLGESGGYVIEDKQAGCPWGPKAREKEAAETQLEFNNMRPVLGGADSKMKLRRGNCLRCLRVRKDPL